jgi:exopolyphosphatase/guanosine-5'-triphosphate,3'-diphosphate pyrophosphatase
MWDDNNDLKISIIDLGYNSIKLANYQVKRGLLYKAYLQEGIKVKAGDDLITTGNIARKSIHRTVDALKMFRDIIKFESIEHVIPVATSAVREAGNREKLLKELKEETGFQFRVLSEEEEALYSYMGALNSTCIPTSLFFDLGGGSLEIVYTENFNVKKLVSLPLGVLKLSQKYGISDSQYTMFDKKDYEKMKDYVIKNLPSRKDLNLSPDTSLIGVGGTLRAIARYDQEVSKYVLHKIHNYRIDNKSVELITTHFSKMTIHELANIEAIGKDRAETITTGSCIIHLLMEKLRFDKIIVSSQGLREGVLLSFLNSKKFSMSLDQIQNSIRFSCQLEKLPRFGRNFVLSLLSTGLFKEREYEILVIALKQISELPYVTNIHNLFYMIIDDDNKYLTHGEQLVLALSIVYTRKVKTANWLFEIYKSILQPQNKQSIEKIAACITLISILQRNRCKVNVKNSSKKEIVVDINIGTSKHQFPHILLDGAIKKTEDVFDISIDYSISFENVASNSDNNNFNINNNILLMKMRSNNNYNNNNNNKKR